MNCKKSWLFVVLICIAFCVQGSSSSLWSSLSSSLWSLFTQKLLTKNCGDEGVFNNASPFEELPLPTCTPKLGVTLRLYTRKNQNVWLPVNTSGTLPETFGSTRPTWFVIHGYRTDIDSHNLWMTALKDAALQLDDVNVILVGWYSLELNYPQAASDTRTMAAMISRLTKDLMDNHGVDRANLYCIGHSLGAHICGYAGQRVTFGRITGMDPAGPLFDDSWMKQGDVGLNPSCADLVDIIHTDSMSALDSSSLGTKEARGHVDFYPNGGRAKQPGCKLTQPACSHDLSYLLFTSSLQQRADCFTADLENNPRKHCSMGYFAKNCQLRGKFYLTTTSQIPYCRPR